MTRSPVAQHVLEPRMGEEAAGAAAARPAAAGGMQVGQRAQGGWLLGG